jgi:hypothetical protein
VDKKLYFFAVNMRNKFFYFLEAVIGYNSLFNNRAVAFKRRILGKNVVI